MELYLRQQEIPMKTDIKVCVIGLGGVGYWVAKFLAMSGVERFILFDPDTLELHNLNRLDIPLEFTGANKANIAKQAICQLRPDCSVLAFPFPFNGEFLKEKVDVIIDCTDKLDVQRKNYEFAKSKHIKYVKVGYDGTHVTIANKPAMWGESPGGYVITPSWVVPAVTVAALAAGAILKYAEKELSADISQLFGNL